MSEPSEFTERDDSASRQLPRAKPFEPVSGDGAHIELLTKHFEEHLGKPNWVIHENLSDLVHIDVHIISPRPDRDFYTLITTGMSARSMKAPEGYEELSYSELMICLPPDWKLGHEDFEDESNYWPIRWLRMLARMPHKFDRWFSVGHTIPNGNPAKPFAPNTKLCCNMLVPPTTAPEEFSQFQITSELKIYIYAVMPLYQEEMDLKLKDGAKAVFERLSSAGINEVLNVKRENIRKKSFGPV